MQMCVKALSCARFLAPTLLRSSAPSKCTSIFRRFLSSDAPGTPAGKVIDVDPKDREEKPEEGKLFLAERSKNIIVANRRFQLSTYNSLPDDFKDSKSIHSDRPVLGKFHRALNKLVIFLRNDKDHKSEAKHIENVKRLSNASIMTGHIDPQPLIPVFTRVGLLPPSVLMVGDMVPVASASEIIDLVPDELAKTQFMAYWFEWHTILHVDLFEKRQQVKEREFLSCFVDPMAQCQHEAVHLANTKYLDFLPSFCKGFLGVPVDDAYFYSVDRLGMSIFGLRAGTEDQWREYRFPFSREIKSVAELEALFKTMIAELLEAERAGQGTDGPVAGGAGGDGGDSHKAAGSGSAPAGGASA